MTITKARRNAAHTVLVNSGVWDASTMHITRDGMVTAKKDADKTNASENTRYNVASLDDLVTENGEIREGF